MLHNRMPCNGIRPAASAPCSPTPPTTPSAHSILCRDEAKKIWAAHEELEASGLRVVCVVHEWIEQEVSMNYLHALPSMKLSTAAQ